MDVALLGNSWDKLSGQHRALVETFYQRFLTTYPEYRRHFPTEMDRQMEKMVETIAFVARVADETEVVHPQLAKIGAKHQDYHLSQSDLTKFSEVFIAVLAEYCADDWSEACETTWREAFETHVIPYMLQGLKAP